MFLTLWRLNIIFLICPYIPLPYMPIIWHKWLDLCTKPWNIDISHTYHHHYSTLTDSFPAQPSSAPLVSTWLITWPLISLPDPLPSPLIHLDLRQPYQHSIFSMKSNSQKQEGKKARRVWGPLFIPQTNSLGSCKIVLTSIRFLLPPPVLSKQSDVLSQWTGKHFHSIKVT